MSKKILVVEDDTSLANLLQHRLKKMGYNVMYAHDGYTGLKLAQKENPDLIVLDVLLPKINGYKICRLLKFDEKYKHIPIIMLTSREGKSQQELGKQTGADQYVLKSDRRNPLLKLIRMYLEPKSIQN